MIDVDLSEWNIWFVKYVKPVFVSGDRDKYFQKIKELQTPFYPKFWIAEKFYGTIKNDTRFDDELKFFFSFLYSCGFFMENIITFEEWLSMKNWENPVLSDLKSETILDIIEKVNGVSELKNKLRWLPFINRQEGF